MNLFGLLLDKLSNDYSIHFQYQGHEGYMKSFVYHTFENLYFSKRILYITTKVTKFYISNR